MKNNTISSEGYNKKELLKIIEEIDSNKQQIKRQTGTAEKNETSESLTLRTK